MKRPRKARSGDDGLVLWNRLAFLPLIFGAIILAFALTLQPKISDDLYILWSFEKSPDTFGWMLKEYREITGRGWIILLTTFVSPYPFLEYLYRLLIVLEVALLCALAWYCALGRGAWQRTRENLHAMTIFGVLLWFALPDRNETVAWLVGNYAYLLPALCGVAFIAWLEYTAADPDDRDGVSRHPISFACAFLLGLCAGISHEQVVATCITYLALVLFPFSRRLLLDRRNIGPSVWFGAAGLILGAALLVSAPGNYVRTTYMAAPGLLNVIERMALYIPGAYFDMGTASAGKYIWLGALVFTLLYFNRDADRREILTGLKRGIFWWMISVVSLLAMAPATNFISTRTAFFAVIFFFVGIAAATCRPQLLADDSTKTKRTAAKAPHFAVSAAALTFLGLLVVVEAFATLISNASVATEFARREEIVKKAMSSTASGDKSPIRVPFIATQTAALTYIQNPQHDITFLGNWGAHVGRAIEHDVGNGAPLPNSLNPLKAIKFRQRN